MLPDGVPKGLDANSYALTEEVQQVTGNNVELVFVDQGYTGSNAAEAANNTACGWRWSNIS